MVYYTILSLPTPISFLGPFLYLFVSVISLWGVFKKIAFRVTYCSCHLSCFSISSSLRSVSEPSRTEALWLTSEWGLGVRGACHPCSGPHGSRTGWTISAITVIIMILTWCQNARCCIWQHCKHTQGDTDTLRSSELELHACMFWGWIWGKECVQSIDTHDKGILTASKHMHMCVCMYGSVYVCTSMYAWFSSSVCFYLDRLSVKEMQIQDK